MTFEESHRKYLATVPAGNSVAFSDGWKVCEAALRAEHQAETAAVLEKAAIELANRGNADYGDARGNERYYKMEAYRHVDETIRALISEPASKELERVKLNARMVEMNWWADHDIEDYDTQSQWTELAAERQAEIQRQLDALGTEKEKRHD
jgi:hypothetical protein